MKCSHNLVLFDQVSWSKSSQRSQIKRKNTYASASSALSSVRSSSPSTITSLRATWTNALYITITKFNRTPSNHGGGNILVCGCFARSGVGQHTATESATTWPKTSVSPFFRGMLRALDCITAKKDLYCSRITTQNIPQRSRRSGCHGLSFTITSMCPQHLRTFMWALFAGRKPNNSKNLFGILSSDDGSFGLFLKFMLVFEAAASLHHLEMIGFSD